MAFEPFFLFDSFLQSSGQIIIIVIHIFMKKRAVGGFYMNYDIYIDGSVDISQEFLVENQIRIMPMQYSLGEEMLEYTKRPEDSFMEEFYQKMAQGVPTRTSQVTPAVYEEEFGKQAAEGNGILFISLSSGLSSSYNSSLLAIENLREQYPEAAIESVDSLAATGGMGLLLLRAVENRRKGLSLCENAENLRELSLKVCHWFMVDDLMFLKRGGRVSAATALVGTALNVKPVLKIDAAGKLVTISKQRGWGKTLRYLTQTYEAAKDAALGEEVILVHGGCKERAEELREQIMLINPEAKVQICMLGPVIGAHTGPGMVAVIHFGNRDYL